MDKARFCARVHGALFFMKTPTISLYAIIVIGFADLTSAAPRYGTNSVGTSFLLPNRGTSAPATDPSPSPAVTAPPTNSVTSAMKTNLQNFLVTAVATNLVEGESIRARWKNPPFPFALTFFDWVGLFRLGARDSDFIERRFVIGLDQEVSFTPPEPGVYEIRYIRWNGERAAVFGPITVNPPPPFRLTIERRGRLLLRLSWPTRTNKVYIVYASEDLKDWEPMAVFTGTGTNAALPVLSTGHASFKVLER